MPLLPPPRDYLFAAWITLAGGAMLVNPFEHIFALSDLDYTEAKSAEILLGTCLMLAGVLLRESARKRYCVLGGLLWGAVLAGYLYSRVYDIGTGVAGAMAVIMLVSSAAKIKKKGP